MKTFPRLNLNNSIPSLTTTHDAWTLLLFTSHENYQFHYSSRRSYPLNRVILKRFFFFFRYILFRSVTANYYGYLSVTKIERSTQVLPRFWITIRIHEIREKNSPPSSSTFQQYKILYNKNTPNCEANRSFDSKRSQPPRNTFRGVKRRISSILGGGALEAEKLEIKLSCNRVDGQRSATNPERPLDPRNLPRTAASYLWPTQKRIVVLSVVESNHPF